MAMPLCCLAMLWWSCGGVEEQQEQSSAETFRPDTFPSRPYTRWWWFSSEIKKKDIRSQLIWLNENGFGGVEIAWLYPLYRMNRHIKRDTSDHPQPWLSGEWSEVVSYAARCCDSLGLGCDFTFGSGWPFGDSYVEKEEGVQVFGDTSFRQMISFSWEYPRYGRVINHLSKKALLHYGNRVFKALEPALEGRQHALFCDSWEIKLNARYKLWTTGFDRLFRDVFGYDILPLMKRGIDSFPDVRYDYMKCLSRMVIDSFYIPFTDICHQAGAVARVQCLSSPTDVMQAYSVVDIPETEAMLNNPDYSRIVSSAACLSSKRLVSSETFTCMYGFPDKYNREEQTADLKMVADALFAQGVNRIIWHGMPFNPAGEDTVDFFASVHVGRKGALAPDLKALNEYLEKVSGWMQRGLTCGQVAVYIPWEDAVMEGAYPPEKQRVWVWGRYEMRYLHYPKTLHSYNPLWINGSFLNEAKVEGGKLVCGDARFDMLYLDVHYMDAEALAAALHLARQGLPVCLRQFPQEPGKIKTEDYENMLFNLAALPNVYADFNPDFPPFAVCDTTLDYWVREENGHYYIFFAHPFCHRLTYPVTSGQSFTADTLRYPVHITAGGHTQDLELIFKPYQSVLLEIDPDGKATWKDIYYHPADPLVKPREDVPMHF